MLEDRRLIRHLGKLRAIRANAAAMLAIAGEHGSFAAWVAAWPGSDIVELWYSARQAVQPAGRQLGAGVPADGGKDTFILTELVSKALCAWKALDHPPSSKRDRAAAQAVFSQWAAQTGRPPLPAQSAPGYERRLTVATMLASASRFPA